MSTKTNDPQLPNYQRPEFVATQPDLDLVHDLLAGTRRMWERASTYIRKWTDEDVNVYGIRSKVETLFEGLGRTLSAAVGMLFAKPPQIEWNQSEEAMTEHWANIDGAGTAGSVFVKRFAEASIRDGLAIILVDHPPAPEGLTITAANEQPLGLRPTWAMYGRGQAVSWRAGVVNNRKVLTQLVLYEAGVENDGEFGIRVVHRYRKLELANGRASWTLYEQVKENANAPESFRVVANGGFLNRKGEPADFLPVSVAYAGRTDTPMQATIPLLGVAWANLSHYRQAANLQFYREMCAFPQPTVKGTIMPDPVSNLPGKLRIGPSVAVHLEADGDFTWTELQGTSLEALERGVLEKEQQIGKLGMAFMITDTRAAETAEAKRLDATAENSTLATAAQGIEDAVNAAYEYHGWYLDIPKEKCPVISISRDYENTAMEPATMAVYIQAVRDAGLPVRTLLEAWLGGGRLPPETDIDALELEMIANAEAEAERKRQELEANMQRQGAA